MPFNSYAFALLFLPTTILLYYAVAFTRLHRLRLPFLIVATIGFYAWSSLRTLPLMLGSILVTYCLSVAMARMEKGRRTVLLAIGIVFNLSILIFFKYTDFLLDNVNAVAGTHLPLPQLVLPLAISFYTFQQIAYLVEIANGSVLLPNATRYAASILFFPILVSGPITFYRELGPQLAETPERRAVPSHLLIGLTIFAMGLFKKTVLADTLVLWASPPFDAAAAGAKLGFVPAWGAALAYLLQMYFDFSGYSDMAIGVGRMLGITLPLNFYSPFRVTNIAEWWRRWHMTLSRWVNLYIFAPITLPATRFAARRGLGRWPVLAIGTLAPTMLTMLVIGAWHGGNWTYFVFGALHGLWLVIYESWRMLTRKRRKGRVESWQGRARGNILVIVAVLIAVVPFRADTMKTTVSMWRGMVGGEGWLGPWHGWTDLPTLGSLGLLIVLIPALAIVYLLPNTEQIMTRFEPALEWSRWSAVSPPVIGVRWRPTIGWALLTGAVLLLGLAYIAGGTATFVYFGF
jgi:alginate O-acetyltransferase complex protein AlgI